MSIDMEQFHQVFFEESFEGLEIMETGLMELEPGPADGELINSIFRAAHSIKGGGGTFGFMHISEFTHVMETLLDEVRDGKREVTQENVDLFLKSVDVLRMMLEGTRDHTDLDQAAIDSVQAELQAMLAGESVVANPDAAASSSGAADAPVPAAVAEPQITGWKIHFVPKPHLLKTGNDPVRLIREVDELGELSATVDIESVPSLQELDPENCYLGWDLTLDGDIGKEQITDIFDWVDGDCELDVEPIVIEPAVEAPVEAAPVAAVPAVDERRSEDRRQEERRKPAAKKKDAGSIRVNVDKIDSLIDLVGELVITQSMLGQFKDEFDLKNLEQLRAGLTQLERNTRDIQESVIQVRMLPISFSFSRFPRLVRDLSSKLGKKIELKLSGENTEVDKIVLEKIGDPMVHLVRNSLDHGLETPEVRVAAGKPETGVLELSACHEGGSVVIKVIDDGAGMNRPKIVEKAIEKGLVSADQVLTDDEIDNMIFQPGFSTADVVSDVSGRGVGMDVVMRNIHELGGNIHVASTPGKGSVLTIRLPLTLAILDGQLVSLGSETFIVPLVSIVESLQIDMDNVEEIAGQSEMYRLRDEFIPIIRLYEVFGFEPDTTRLDEGLLVVVEADGKHVGLFVDDLHGQQQVVIKSLASNFVNMDGISGATILGDGTVALILDTQGLVEYYNKQKFSNNTRRSAVA